MLAIAGSVLPAVGVYYVLQWRVNVLEKWRDDHTRKDELLAATLGRIETTLARMDERLAHMEARPWWKG